MGKQVPFWGRVPELPGPVPAAAFPAQVPSPMLSAHSSAGLLPSLNLPADSKMSRRGRCAWTHGPRRPLAGLPCSPSHSAQLADSRRGPVAKDSKAAGQPGKAREDFSLPAASSSPSASPPSTGLHPWPCRPPRLEPGSRIWKGVFSQGFSSPIPGPVFGVSETS